MFQASRPKTCTIGSTGSALLLNDQWASPTYRGHRQRHHALRLLYVAIQSKTLHKSDVPPITRHVLHQLFNPTVNTKQGTVQTHLNSRSVVPTQHLALPICFALHTLWHSVFPESGSLFEYIPGRVVAEAANPTVLAALPGPTLGGPRLETVAAISSLEPPPEQQTQYFELRYERRLSSIGRRVCMLFWCQQQACYKLNAACTVYQIKLNSTKQHETATKCLNRNFSCRLYYCNNMLRFVQYFSILKGRV